MRLVRIQAGEIPMVDMLAILRYAPEYDTPWVTGAVQKGAIVAYRIEGSSVRGTALLALDLAGKAPALLLFGLAVQGRRWKAPVLALLRHLATLKGCSAIRGVSPRAGWARWARPVGKIWEVNLKEGS